MLDRSTVSTLLPILALVASGCFQDVADIDDDAAATDPATCSPGNETCMCFPNETCNAGLSCLSGLCVLAGGTSGTGLGLAAASDEMSNSNDSGTGDPAGASGTEGTSEAGDASTDEGDDSSDTSSDAGTTTTSTTGDPDLPLALIPNADGWIARHSNRFGFQGPWFTFAAAQGATIVPSEEERWVPDEAGAMCMSGTVDRVPCESVDDAGVYDLCDYDNYWGAVGAMHLCYPGEADPLPPEGDETFTLSNCPWIDVPGLHGFRFRITGDVPPDTRVVFRELHQDLSPFVSIDAAEVVALFEDAEFFEDRALDIDDIAGLNFQVSSSPASAKTFDFCISDLEPVF